MSGFKSFDDLPGLKRVAPRRSFQSSLVASLLAAAWPPILVTQFIWVPRNWASGVDTDWRIVLLVVGLIAVPIGLHLLHRSYDRHGRPSTRLGVIFRFMIFGGLLAAALQSLIAVTLSALSMLAAPDFIQAMGALQTTLLIFGVVGLPLAILVGISYAIWAGICIAFIAFRSAPVVRPHPASDPLRP